MLRTFALLAVALVVGAAGIYLLKDQPLRRGLLRVEDFGAYWSAARVNLAGGDPYEPAQLDAEERRIAPDRTSALMAWGTPWSLALVMPFAGLDFAIARVVWVVLQAVLLLLGAELLWRVYSGPPEYRLIGWLVCFTWYPCWQLFGLGQLSIFTFVGMAGFLFFMKRNLDFFAGMCAGLAIVKPQTVLIFWAAVALWSIQHRRPALLTGIMATVLVASAIVLLPNPAIFGQYVHALTYRPPAEMMPPTAGSVLRLVFGGRFFGLAFVPTLLGLVWLSWQYSRYRQTWDWSEQLPLVLFASFLTTPYGWIYDLVYLLLPWLRALQVAEGRGPHMIVVFAVVHVALNGLALAMNVMRYQEFMFLWMAPALLLAYLVLVRDVDKPPPRSIVPA